jgi:hypothetical protein
MATDIYNMDAVGLANAAVNQAVGETIYSVKLSIFTSIKHSPRIQTYDYTFHGVDDLIVERAVAALAKEGFTATKVPKVDNTYRFGGWALAQPAPFR